MLIWLLIIAVVIILDQVSKIIMMRVIPPNGHIDIIPGFFRLSQVKNTGAAFGMLGGEKERWIFIVASVIGIGALLVYLWKFRPKSKWACAALSMIIGGGIGNMIDRCFRVGEVYNKDLGYPEIRHYVFDFIDFHGIWPYVFNVADSFVCIGAGILMVWCICSFVLESKNDKKKKLVDESAVSVDTTDVEEDVEASSDDEGVDADASDIDSQDIDAEEK